MFPHQWTHTAMKLFDTWANILERKIMDIHHEYNSLQRLIPNLFPLALVQFLSYVKPVGSIFISSATANISSYISVTRWHTPNACTIKLSICNACQVSRCHLVAVDWWPWALHASSNVLWYIGGSSLERNAMKAWDETDNCLIYFSLREKIFGKKGLYWSLPIKSSEKVNTMKLKVHSAPNWCDWVISTLITYHKQFPFFITSHIPFIMIYLITLI